MVPPRTNLESPLDTEKRVAGISAGIKFSLDAIKFVSSRSVGMAYEEAGWRGGGKEGRERTKRVKSLWRTISLKLYTRSATHG